MRHTLAEASPRDDLESLSYMLIYFLHSTLPWRKLRAATIVGTWDLICDVKLSIGSELHAEWCVMRDLSLCSRLRPCKC